MKKIPLFFRLAISSPQHGIILPPISHPWEMGTANMGEKGTVMKICISFLLFNSVETHYSWPSLFLQTVLLRLSY
jgi:hypothetical protein